MSPVSPCGLFWEVGGGAEGVRFVILGVSPAAIRWRKGRFIWAGRSVRRGHCFRGRGGGVG